MTGDVHLTDLQTESVGLTIGGSGSLETSGRGQKLRISIAGSGDVTGDKFDADEVAVEIAGSGNASVKANKTLKVAIAGSGDVVYSGDPKVTQSIAGSGSVTRR